MKVAIEATVLTRKQAKTGVYFYTLELLRAAALEMSDSQLFLCYIQLVGQTAPSIELKAKNVIERRFRYFSGRGYRALHRYLLAAPFNWFAGMDADVYLFPNFVRWPLMGKRKSVVIVHDLSYLDCPQYTIPRHQRFLSKFVPRGVAKATRVVTISEFSKGRIEHYYGVKPDHITVIEPALDHKLYRPASDLSIRKVRAKFGIQSKYILFLATIEPRKNLVRLLQAYSSLPNDLKAEYVLVLAGGKGWLDDEINQLATELGDRVLKTGYLDEADKPALYSGASVFAFPSIYEGWGMPAQEAMACGTPVVVSNNSSLPEVVGEAGLMVDPLSVVAIAKGLEKVLTDPRLAHSMSTKGLTQSKKFTWEVAGKKLRDVLVEAAND